MQNKRRVLCVPHHALLRFWLSLVGIDLFYVWFEVVMEGWCGVEHFFLEAHVCASNLYRRTNLVRLVVTAARLSRWRFPATWHWFLSTTCERRLCLSHLISTWVRWYCDSLRQRRLWGRILLVKLACIPVYHGLAFGLWSRSIQTWVLKLAFFADFVDTSVFVAVARRGFFRRDLFWLRDTWFMRRNWFV